MTHKRMTAIRGGSGVRGGTSAIGLLSLLLPGWIATPAQAEHWLESGVPLATAENSQWDPQAVPDGEGGAIVVWSDWRGSDWDLYAQRLDPWGRALWAEDGIPVCTTGGDQDRPRAIPDGAGGMIVAWRDARNGSSNTDIYAQRLDASGATLWRTQGAVVCSLMVVDQLDPVLATDGAGGAIVAWLDERTGSSVDDVYAQRLDGSGDRQWSTHGVAVCNAVGAQSAACIVEDGSGGAILAWRDGRTAQYDIYAQRLDGAGSDQWPSNGVPLCATVSADLAPCIVSDSAGGAFVAWQQDVAGADDICAQHVSSSGAIQWGSTGLAVAAWTGDQTKPQICRSGGGIIVAWEDTRSGNKDVYAQRVRNSGIVDWTVGGVAICTASNDQHDLVIQSDDAGGAILVWADDRNGGYAETDIYAQRVDTAGSTLWDAGDVPLCTSPGQQSDLTVTTDGAGGAIFAYRTGLGDDVWAQRITYPGYWGYPSAYILSVDDVPGDEGGVVSVRFEASRLEAVGGIDFYDVWTAESPDGPWTSVAGPPPDGSSEYTVLVPTLNDSTSVDPAIMYFYVSAWGNLPVEEWISPVESGYSVDNLPPGMPANLAGEELSDTQYRIYWDPNAEPDLSHYAIYMGSTRDFVPEAGNLLATTADTSYVHVTGARSDSLYYKVSAWDIHENEGEFATHARAMTTGTPQVAATHGNFLAPCSPNPFRAATRIEFALERPGRVSLEIFDVRGRRIRTLLDDLREVGRHAAAWDGTDASGRASAAGVYFCRMTAPGWTATRPMVLR